MALEKCPECGRENVSDSAESCPGCGYKIKAHFDKIKMERIHKESEAKEHERMKESIKKPEKPRFSRGFLIYGVIAAAFFSWLMLYTPTTYGADPGWGKWIFELALFIGIPSLFFIKFYKMDVEDYELASRDFEAYQEKVIAREKKIKAEKIAMERSKERMKPECPYCHSHDTAKITFNEVFRDDARILYQWRCNRCDSEF